MGGYGLLNVIGGGYSEASVTANGARPIACCRTAPPRTLLARPRTRVFVRRLRLRRGGMQNGFWDAAGLAGIHTPVLFVAGSADTVAGYERGTKWSSKAPSTPTGIC